ACERTERGRDCHKDHHPVGSVWIMSNAFGLANRTIDCERCGRPYEANDKDAARWNARFSAGTLIGYICPRCQTAADSLEAQVNGIELEDSQVGFLDQRGWRAL